MIVRGQGMILLVCSSVGSKKWLVEAVIVGFDT